MKKASKTREYIIENTAPVFNKKGYFGTSMADITKATGLTKGAIYGNFSDKEEVAVAALEYNINKLNYKITTRVVAVDTAKEKFNAYLEVFQEMAPDVLNYGGCAYMNSAIETDDTNPHLFKIVQKRFKGWIHGLEKLVEMGQQANEISNQVNPTEFAYFFVSIVEGSILLSKTLNNPNVIYNNLEILRKQIDNIFL
ncbi:hypothetical protein NBRC110019_07190 [Neptunitalea chrysea]|uniref:HTH tetR-type domain-containing protein n=1 Tax=Neptunitalea chrysea TaxID=1647581 RepID=A0A9W6ETC0_9FLAO|nr:TetR/AcrR family transcriptional regulator [Neptunitalea chrysea]GLB51680.1 hypothetical protein NBRC110019_07190 [Neptunitalea chrysea]